jgi:hypothetical protein
LKDDYQYHENFGSFVELLGSPVVFLHEINTLPNFSKIISQVDGIEKYDRAVPIARPDDVILTKVQPDPSYLKWLESQDFGTKKIVVLNGKPTETLPERVIKNGTKFTVHSHLGACNNDAILSPYFGGTLEHQVSRYLNLTMYADPKIVHKYDSKINFKTMCRRLGVPVINEDHFTLKSKNEKGLEGLVNVIRKRIDETGKVIVRGEYGASASSTYIIDCLTSPKLQELIIASNLGDRFLVESFYDTYADPSAVLFISNDKRIFHLRTSNQILDTETSHIGNEFPVQFDEKQVNDYSLTIAKQFASEGFIGPFGIDYISTKSGIFAAECNPRITGAMYPWELVKRLEERDSYIRAARAQNIHLPRKGFNFSDLQRVWSSILYTDEESEGIVFPFNVGPLSDGKVTVLGTGSSLHEVDAVLDYAKSSLNSLYS